jgi:HAD superfamily hydrolase (TIGR01450 family)
MTAGTVGQARTLSASDGTLLAGHDLLILDLDGVVFVGDQPIEGATEALNAARGSSARLVFVTNNASRPPAAVAEHLRTMGIGAQPAEVMTSAVVAATELARQLPEGSPVLVVGGSGVRLALSEAGLRPVQSAAEGPVAVVQGFAPEVDWAQLAEATVAIRAGARWIATNTDRTLPSPRGPLPGNGPLVAAVATATGATPDVIGKPQPAMFEAAATGSERPLVVGDRLDTDIAGARAAGLASLLVLTGVSRAADLIAASPDMRPDHVGRDLGALALSHPGSQYRDGVAACGSVEASIVDRRVRFGSTGDPATGDDLDGLRVLCALAWSEHATLPTTDPAYAEAVSTLDLD